MNNKHTSGTTGKWRIVPISNCCLTIQCDGFREDKRGEYIAEIKWQRVADGINEEDKANAKLIAAAPELLESLTQLYNLVITSTDRKIFDNGANAEIVAQAKAAIIKTTN